MDIITPQYFNKGWYELKTGTGFVTYTFGGSVVEVDANGTDKASVSTFTQARGGDVVEVKVQARNLDRHGGTATLFINGELSGATQNFIEITSTEWREYTVRIAIPLGVNDSAVQVGFGVFGSGSGAAQFTKPKINIKNSGIGASGVILKGVINLATGGTASVNTSYANCGIGSVAWGPTSNVITVTLENSMVFEFNDGVTNNKFLPNIQITPRGENMNTGDGPITWAINNHQSANGTFEIVGLLPSGAIIDADTMSQAVLSFHIIVTI